MHAFVGEEEHTPRKKKNICKHIMCLENHTSLAGSKILWRSREKRGNGGRQGTDFFFFLRLITLQYCIGFAIHCHETATGAHVFPILNPPPTSLFIPSLWVSPEHLALNLDWQFVSHMIIYTFQCHSPKPSHPLPLPQSPKDCSIHLCFFCCLAYRVIVTIFLNSIYMC